MTEVPQFVVGIDLGTSNCAMARAAPGEGAAAGVSILPVPQVQRLGQIGEQPLLPSCIYFPSAHELPAGSVALPWDAAPGAVAGEFARWQGARVPGRLVVSAKSWLCHGGVDRAAPILPWGGAADVEKISPVVASGMLLRHLAAAWGRAYPDSPLSKQELIITVPASFDEVGRALTVQAARWAGLDRFILLEEPQAAFYDFIAGHRGRLNEILGGARLVLVIDVGGGTADFTLVQVSLDEGEVGLRRIAVGEHLMLGGDNMDATLARRIEERLAKGRKLDSSQWGQLFQSARAAKESLLSRDGQEVFHLAVAASGSRLLGGTMSAELTRDEAAAVILDGFFPFCAPGEMLRRSARVAIQELGLPFAQDPAVTRHLSAFLRIHAGAGWNALGMESPDPAAAALPRPDAILLNGGVFNSDAIAQRLLDVVSSWWPSAPRIPLLEHGSLELSVARGAAYYGLVRRGLGKRIGGGTAHAFYVGLGQDEARRTQALCLVPRGQEEGQTLDLGERVFQLTLGRPVQFPLYTTASDRLDRLGDVVPVDDDLRPLPPIHTVLKGSAEDGTVPVHLRTTLTEIGTLELWCVSDRDAHQWRLEFQLRGDTGRASDCAVTESLPARAQEAREWIERIYGSKPGGKHGRQDSENLAGVSPPKDVKHLWSSLEKSLGRRDTWRVSWLREMWSALLAGASKRRRSADHERIFFQLTGFTLRPGFGYPLDAWRCEQTFALFPAGVQFHKDKAVWKEFWILWRRIAGGLDDGPQAALWEYLKPHLAQRLSGTVAKHAAKPKGVQPHDLDEMVRTAASLEHLPVSEKMVLSQWVMNRLKDPSTPAGGPWAWSLGRLGARVPAYGSGHKVVPPDEAARWIEQLLEMDLARVDGAPFALTQLARLTGDRSRDVDDETRGRVVEALQGLNAPEAWRRLVVEVVELESGDESRVLGDTLPAGLRLN